MILSRLLSAHNRPALLPVGLVVEDRDDFFSGVASSLAAAHFSILRATSADAAHAYLESLSPDLIVVNCELTDESGWLMASKWCFGGRHRRVWLYQTSPAAFDEDWRRFTKVERMFYHEEDASSLASQMKRQLMVGK